MKMGITRGLLLVCVCMVVFAAVAVAEDTMGLKPTKDALVLFDGKDLSQFVSEKDGSAAKWKVENGEMVIVPRSGSILTKDTVTDFRLHLEFNIAPLDPVKFKGQSRGNSGIYIQRRYELQILDSYGEEPVYNSCGSLYRTKKADKSVCRKAGEWQTYDILFRAARFNDEGKKIEDARITVIQNGEVIHNNVALRNKTGAGNQEGPKPDQIRFQDHGNVVNYRNIWLEHLTPAPFDADEKKKK